jgi:hypothetical protein
MDNFFVQFMGDLLGLLFFLLLIGCQPVIPPDAE